MIVEKDSNGSQNCRSGSIRMITVTSMAPIPVLMQLAIIRTIRAADAAAGFAIAKVISPPHSGQRGTASPRRL